MFELHTSPFELQQAIHNTVPRVFGWFIALMQLNSQCPHGHVTTIAYIIPITHIYLHNIFMIMCHILCKTKKVMHVCFLNKYYENLVNTATYDLQPGRLSH